MSKTTKRLASAVLSVLMILGVLLCLGFVSFAAEDNEASTVKSTSVETARLNAEKKVKSIKLTPVKAYVLYEGLASGYDYYDGSGYYYYLPNFNAGDKLTITYTDSTTEVFKFTAGKSPYDVGSFVSSSGKKIDYYDLDCQSTQQVQHWTVGGKYNYFTVAYGGAVCKVPVTIKKNPIQSISAKYKYTVYKPDRVDFDDWYEEILDEYVIYTLKLTDGSTFSGTKDQVASEFGCSPSCQIKLTALGTNKGTCSLASFTGVFSVKVARLPSSAPSCALNITHLTFIKGQKVDIQLLQFADKGYTHYIKVLEIPDGLKLSRNGRLTGTVNLDYSSYGSSDVLSFDVRWKDTDVHTYSGRIGIFVFRQSDKVKIPSNATTLAYNKATSVSASGSNPKWFKFRARGYGFWITSKAANPVDEYSNGMTYQVFDSQGLPVFPDGMGDGADGFTGGGYGFNRGDYYYIKATSSGKIKLHFDSWMPSWNSDNDSSGEDTYKLIKTNYQKTFSGDGTRLWNVYSVKATINKDCKNDFTYTTLGTMRRYASPVNIFMQTTAKSNADIIGSESFKYDPNNAKECKAIGASTKQETMKKDLLKGEKEYRFDTVYYLMPQIGKLTLVDSSLLYVPSCYKLDSKHEHVVKRSGHTNTAKITKATTTKDGKAVYHCNACKVDVRIDKLYKVTTFKLTATQYTYDGKVKTPGVVVRDSKGNALRNGTDYTVKYASGRTNTGRYSVVITLKGKYSGSKTLYFNIVPGVTGKIAVGQTTSLIKISWDAVPGASGYRIYLYDMKEKIYKPYAETKKTSFVFTDLKPTTVYKIGVRAFKTVGKQILWSENYKAVATATKPEAPTLTATPGTGRAVLKWTKQSGATGYVVYMSQTQNGTYKRIANLKGDSNVTVTRTGLKAGTTYYFKVQAYKIISDTVIYSADSTVKSVRAK